MPTYHRDDVEPSAIHPAAFVGATDPAGDVDNHVGPHKLWIDTSSSTFKIKKRDAGNAAWEVVASLTHADLTGLTTGDPHTQYLLKSLATTKGDILVATAAGTWVRLPAGSDGYILTADAGETDGVLWASPASISGAHVIQDVTSDVSQRGKLAFVGATLTDDAAGGRTVVTIAAPGMTNPMTTAGDLIVGGVSGAPARLAKGADTYILTIDPTTHLIVWAAPPAGSGTVTSVAVTAAPSSVFDVSGSPITGAGTIAISMDSQAANTSLAGPTSGGSATPAFRAMVAADVPINLRRMSIAFQFGDGTNAIDSSTEREQWLELNFDGTIEGYSLTADVSGSIVIDLWKDTYANYPPVVGDSIVAAAKPTLSAAQKAQDTTLTGWTTTFARGQTLKAHVDSAGTVKAVTLTLYIVKT